MREVMAQVQEGHQNQAKVSGATGRLPAPLGHTQRLSASSAQQDPPFLNHGPPPLRPRMDPSCESRPRWVPDCPHRVPCFPQPSPPADHGPPHMPLSLSRVSLCPHFSSIVPTWAQALTKVTWDLLGGLGLPDVLSAGSTRTRPPSNTSLWHTHHALHSPCLLALHTRGPNPRGGQEEPSRASVGQHVRYKAERGVCQRLGLSSNQEVLLGRKKCWGPARLEALLPH